MVRSVFIVVQQERPSYVYIRPHSGIYTSLNAPCRCSPAKGLPLAGENDLPGMDQRPPTYDAYLWASKLGSIFAKEARCYETS